MVLSRFTFNLLLLRVIQIHPYKSLYINDIPANIEPKSNVRKTFYSALQRQNNVFQNKTIAFCVFFYLYNIIITVYKIKQ